ncbi:MAG: hypothetical protein AAGC71_00220 [Pseudomonadota bacterium]
MTLANRVSTIALIFTSCAAMPALGDEPEWVAADVPDGRRLCIVGNEVVALEPTACATAQRNERQPTSTINETLDNTDILLTTPSIGLDLFEAINVGVQYAYEVGRSYRDDYYTRVDRYSVATTVKPGDRIGGLPVRVALTAGSEIVFAQQFASGAAARAIKHTYTPERLPLTAERAIALKPGDYVRFNATLSLLATLDQLFSLPTEVVASNIGLNVLARGGFQVHVFRLDAERVRLKLIAERSGETGATFSASPNLPISLAGIDTRAAALVEFARFDRSIRLALSRARNHVVLVDYTLDLETPDVRAAYDNLFHAARRLRLSTGDTNDTSTLVGDLAALDALAGSSERVQRNFKGATRANSRRAGIGVSLRSYDVQRERVFREKLLSRVRRQTDGRDGVDYFLVPTWSRIRERAAFFGTLDERMEQSAEAMFSANDDGTPREFIHLGFTFAYVDSILRQEEYKRIRNKIELLLTTHGETALAEQLVGTGWLQSSRHRDVRMRLHYYFHDTAFRALTAAGLDETELMYERLVDFAVAAIDSEEFPYHQGGLDELISTYSRTLRPKGAERTDRYAYARRVVQTLWGAELRRTTKRLVRVLDTSLAADERLEAFVKLRWSSYYRKLGPAIWVYLLETVDVDPATAMYVTLELDARNRAPVYFEFGNDTERDLYEAVRRVESILNDRSIDMRESGPLDSVIARMRIVEGV